MKQFLRVKIHATARLAGLIGSENEVDGVIIDVTVESLLSGTNVRECETKRHSLYFDQEEVVII